MRRLVKFDVIGETSYYIKQQLNELKEQKNKLLNTIDRIHEGYKGIDADNIIAKYKEKTKKIDEYIQTMEQYVIYFDWLSGNYRDCQDEVEKELVPVEINLEPTDDNVFNEVQ